MYDLNIKILTIPFSGAGNRFFRIRIDPNNHLRPAIRLILIQTRHPRDSKLRNSHEKIRHTGTRES